MLWAGWPRDGLGFEPCWGGGQDDSPSAEEGVGDVVWTE